MCLMLHGVDADFQVVSAVRDAAFGERRGGCEAGKNGIELHEGPLVLEWHQARHHRQDCVSQDVLFRRQSVCLRDAPGCDESFDGVARVSLTMHEVVIKDEPPGEGEGRVPHEGAMLWQSQTDSDYKYEVFYGHDVPMRDINWTHALHVATWPLIYARCVKNIKLTGGG